VKLMKGEDDLKLNLCLNCRRRLLTCVCKLLKPFTTHTKFVILMHPMEFKKEKVGTGRFSHLILTNSEIIVDLAFDSNKQFTHALNDPNYQSFLLYPGDNSLDIREMRSELSLDKRPLQIFVIDGTWPCAKKMVKLTPSLHRLPRISFKSNRVSKFQIKHQPIEGCLSTVESLHQVIIELNEIGVEKTQGQEQNLMDVFLSTVDQQLSLASDPNRQGYRKKPFSTPEQRKISKKWSGRSLYFKPESE
jgi:DTW domain-containing protein